NCSVSDPIQECSGNGPSTILRGFVPRLDALYRRNVERVDRGARGGIGRPSLTKSLGELRDTQAKLRQVLAGRSITTDQPFWYNLDDALYALEEIAPGLADVAQLERVRVGILDWQNELAAAHT